MTLRTSDKDAQEGEVFNMTETGLSGVLFSMLDTETDSKLIKDIHDTLTSMLQVLAAENLTLWLSLCKDVLTVASGMLNFSYRSGIILKQYFHLLYFFRN